MFNVPPPPKIKLKAKPPDQRKIAVVPLRALRDKNLNNYAIRVLALLCSYANRAGITWVAGTTLAKELGVCKQSISRQMAQLKRTGYVEVVRRGYAGQRTDTVRIIYDPTISTTDVLSILGNEDDYRSPTMLNEELNRMNQPISNKPIKKTKPITKSNKVVKKVDDNKTQDIREIYLRVLKKEKEIKEKDIKGIEMVQDSNVSIDSFLTELELRLKMIASEGLRVPDDILELTQQILRDSNTK